MSKFVAIVYNPVKEETKRVIDKLKNLFSEEGLDFFLVKSDYSNFSANIDIHRGIKKPDYVVSVGGDGTILYSARLFAQYEVPIIGIDVGKLGFLMHFSESEIENVVKMIKEDNFKFENRMMISVIVRFKSGREFFGNALNEVVVSRGKFHRLLDIDVFVDGEYLNTYRADGIIVSTPTGSTAYSLSAFGPIAMPTMENLIITPICPHTLSARSIILESTKSIVLKIGYTTPPSVVVMDGQDYIDIDEEVEVEVTKCSFYAKVVTNPKINFFEVLRRKLNW
ncbi:MAG: NAD(+)/NADH kinase [Spirochaetia bacterium]|nr:NAD(+)/NADH kinase [Spirochaetota bacterium]MDW8112091.1 NAD(+)/NADH kinase [Spirochaetia bacterium]